MCVSFSSNIDGKENGKRYNTTKDYYSLLTKYNFVFNGHFDWSSCEFEVEAGLTTVHSTLTDPYPQHSNAITPQCPVSFTVSPFSP